MVVKCFSLPFNMSISAGEREKIVDGLQFNSLPQMFTEQWSALGQPTADRLMQRPEVHEEPLPPLFD